MQTALVVRRRQMPWPVEISALAIPAAPSPVTVRPNTQRPYDKGARLLPAAISLQRRPPRHAAPPHGLPALLGLLFVHAYRHTSVILVNMRHVKRPFRYTP